MGKLEGKCVLVTGGGSGIGLASARLLLAEGARVAISGRDEAKLRRAADSLQGGDRLISIAADVTDHAQVRSLVERVTQRFGPIDILVNNAGVNIPKRSFRELTPESFRSLIQANLEGAFYCMQAVLPSMLERHEGLIVNINSMSAMRSGPLSGAGYASAKSGLRALATCLAEEVREAGIRVSSIFPGDVDTPILENRPKPATAEHRKQILQPDDVAAAVLFVATLPPRASVPEIVIKPSVHSYI